MTAPEKIDSFFRRHPRLLLLAVIIATELAGIVLLGGLRDVGLVYKAF